MSLLDDKMIAWTRRLRLVAYAFGFAGLALMLIARSGDDPAFHQTWSQRSMMCIGLMMATFIAYYVLNMLRMNRR